MGKRDELSRVAKRRATIIENWGSVEALGKHTGELARKANIERYGLDYYQRLGHKGGATPTTKPKGFAADRERASWAGRIGGTKSRRKPVE